MTASAAVWTPPRLKQAPEHDALWNALVSHFGAALPLAGRSAATVIVGEPPAGDATAVRMRVAAGPRFFAVPVAFPFVALSGADLSVPDLAALPDVLRDAMLDAILAIVASALPQTPWGSMTIEHAGSWTEVGPAEPDTAALRWLRVTLQGVAPEPVVLDLGATLPSMADLFGAVSPRRVWSGLTTRLTRAAYVTLGRLQLSVAELRGLPTGSVVVLAAGVDPAVAMVRCDGSLYRFGRTERGWACLAVETCAPIIRNDPMSDRTDEVPLAAEAAPLPRRLQVHLDLDLGTLAVPLAELETWQPGSIVALQPASIAQGVEVTLRCNGQAIGTGDLVTIDDRIGVRISSLNFET